jgi:UDP-GlcNAc:undecaprenyl-phosphate GlcNAc-1-phosphate transferase
MPLESGLETLRHAAALLVAFAAAVVLIPPIRRGAVTYGVLDRPDGRLKRHREPIPYLGGVAIYLAFLFALGLLTEFTREVLAILLGSSIVMALGLFDDLKALAAGAKLSGQIVAALVVLKAGVMINLSFLPEWLLVVLTLVWLVGVTNAVNLLDGSDGLASGVSAIAGVFLAAVAIWNGQYTLSLLALALVGSSLGFLVYNRPPARIFMGDTGSHFIGFILGALAMSGDYTDNNLIALLAPVLILGFPLFDTAYVMTVRALRGVPVMKGSPDHVADRLRDNGFTAWQINAVAYGTTALLGGAALGMCLGPSWLAWSLLGSVGALTFVGVLVLNRLGRTRQPRVSVPNPAVVAESPVADAGSDLRH